MILPPATTLGNPGVGSFGLFLCESVCVVAIIFMIRRILGFREKGDVRPSGE